MLNKADGVKWLEKRTEEYRSGKSDMKEVVDDFDEVGKLGRGFLSVDKLEEVDIGDDNIRRPTYINANLAPRQREKVREMLREFVDCFIQDYTEMPGLSRELVEHCLPIKPGFRPHR